MISIILTREKTSNLLLRAGPWQTSDPDHVTFVIQRHPQVLQNSKRTVSYYVVVGSPSSRFIGDRVITEATPSRINVPNVLTRND